MIREIANWHKRVNELIGERPIEVARRLIDEEYAELIAEIERLERSGVWKQEIGAAIAKEAADLIVVAVQLLLALGTDPESVVAEVNAANFSKLVEPTVSNGKLLKGAHYKAPNLLPLIPKERDAV